MVVIVLAGTIGVYLAEDSPSTPGPARVTETKTYNPVANSSSTERRFPGFFLREYIAVIPV